MSKSIPVERATVHLGNVGLAVFKFKDGTYNLSQTQVAEIVGKMESSVRRFLGSKCPEALPWLDYRPAVGQVKTEKNAALINLCPIELAAAYWLKETLAGNREAAILLGACAADSIQRRADKAFGIDRTEQEERFAFEVFRKFMKETRLEFTDSIADHMVVNQITGPKATFMYANASDAINRILFGKTAKQLRIDNKCSITRDGLTFAQVRDIENIEKTSARLIRELNLNPVEAVKKAALLHGL